MAVIAPPYQLLTERLRLRPYAPTDAATLRDTIARNRGHLGPWLPWAMDEETLDERLAWVLGSRATFEGGRDYPYGAFDEDTGALVGGAGLHTRCGEGGLEVGYWVAKENVRRGLATEMAAVLTRTAIERCHCVRVELRVDPRNSASLGVPEKLGFEREGLLRRRTQHRGKWVDLVSYCMLPEALRDSPAAGYTYEARDALDRPIRAHPFPEAP